jgi:hypothetical protein
MARDCKETGCVVSSLANYTTQLLDPTLPFNQRNQAAKFVVHFVGDIHQPLHAEDVARGGNGIQVKFQGHDWNLHHVWDSTIAERAAGGTRGGVYKAAARWAAELLQEIEKGKYAEARRGWEEGMDLKDAEGTAMVWARESNAYVCSHVLPEGAAAIAGQELGGAYFEKAAPVIEIQVARAGYRLAKWMDLVAEAVAAGEMGEL